MTPAARKLIALMLLDVRRLMRALEAGRATVEQWQRDFSEALARYHTAEYMVGQGNTQLSGAGRRYLGKTVEAQLRFLNNWALEIQDEAQFKLGWNARAALYAQGIGASWWRGATRMLPLPAMPRDGTCVTTPQSRVLTRRGHIPIADVITGDSVWTHAHRWRPVVAVRRAPANDRQFAHVGVAGRPMVGFTTDHRLYSRYGWTPVSYIDSRALPVYTIPIAKGDSNAEYGMPDVWRDKGLSGERVPVVRCIAQGAGAVGNARCARQDGARYPGHEPGAAACLCGSDRGDELADQERWSGLRLLLGWRQQALYLPLSVAMADDLRRYTAGLRHPSQERRSDRRSDREPGVHFSERPQQGASTCEHAENDQGQRHRTDRRGGDGMRTVRDNLRYPYADEVQSVLFAGVLPPIDAPSFDVDMPAVRHDVPGAYGTWARPEILFAGMLDQGATLYDIEVADDHSFVIEGIVAHNSQCLGNCTCSWEIIELDGEGNYDCHWKLGATERHCQTCPTRARDWAPLKIRNGRLQ